MAPRSGENFGAVAALVKPPAATAAPPRASEKLRAALYFRDRVVSSSQKNTKIDQISCKMEMEMQQKQELHLSGRLGFILVSFFFLFQLFII